MEAYLLNEIEVCERMAKKMKRFNKITSIMDTGLITSKVITGVVSVAFASSIGLFVDISLSGTSLVFTQKSFKICTMKQEKRNAIKLIDQRKLANHSTANIFSRKMPDVDISSIGLHNV